ncbi:unnamed protein product [Ectocarpus sp. 13 AM-2016]
MSGIVINGAALCDVNEDELAGNGSSRTCTLPGGSMDAPIQCNPRQVGTVEDGVWTYDAERLCAKLASIPTQGMDMDEVTANVKKVCYEEGVQVATSDSRKGKDGRYVSRELKCKLGMRNRQNDHKAENGGQTVPKILRKSQRIGCPFKVGVLGVTHSTVDAYNRVAIRWPTKRKARQHPYLSDRATTLSHNHTVAKDVDTIPLPKRQASSDSLVMANPYKLRECEAKSPGHETRDDRRDRAEGLRATAFDLRKRQKEEEDENRRGDIKRRILRSQEKGCLDDETCDFLVDMWDKGELIDGTKGFGNGADGFDNGLFCGYLHMANAPPYLPGRRDDATVSFWSKGTDRLRYTEHAFKACFKAHFPVVLEGDDTHRSVMGTACKSALSRRLTRIGGLGGRHGTSIFGVSPGFVKSWNEGVVDGAELIKAFGTNSTWTIQNFEGDEKVDAQSFNTIKCSGASDLVRNTRMGGLCHPHRPRTRGGVLTGTKSVRGKSWSGSEVTAFAKRRGGVTHSHVDAQMVHGESFILPAAGIMRSVNRRGSGPSKRAILMCAHDMERVVDLLALDVSKPYSSQYTGEIVDLEGLATRLRANGIRFILVDFPECCSYAIPARCAHMFVTLRLVESCAWHPILNV